MSRRWSIRFVAITSLIGACTSGSQPAEPTAPADQFAPTPTIGELAAPTTTRPTPTTTVDVERTSAYPVDPVTLEPLPGFEPIPMGDWAWGVNSPNGRWLVLIHADDDGLSSGASLIDVPRWEMVADWPQLSSPPLTVTDDGAVYFVDHSGPAPQLVRARVGSTEHEILAQLPSHFSPWDQPRLREGRLTFVGQSFEADSILGNLDVVTFDLTSSAVIETPIPAVTFGPTEFVELGDGQTGVVDTIPAFTWDERQSSYLIVHAMKDLIVEFDTISGSITEHRFGDETDETTAVEVTQSQINGADLWASHRRSAVLSPNGQTMYLSGAIGAIVQTDEAAVATSTPAGILAIDTTTWEIVDRLDVPVSDLYISPDGQTLISSGNVEQFAVNSYDSEASGLYVIDTDGLDVLVHHPARSPEEYLGPVTYSFDGALAYATSFGGVESVYVVEAGTGTILNHRENVRMLGQVAAVAGWSEG